MDTEAIKDDCKAKAIYALSTSHIFSRRRVILDRWQKFNTTLGILVPALLGAFISTYGNYPWLISISGLLGMIQLILSILSLVYRWDDKISYYLESCKDNRRLYEEYSRLYQQELDEGAIITKYQILLDRDSVRNDKDEEYTFSYKEDRRGMRYALYITQNECATCLKIPRSLKKSNCDTCGNF